VLLVVNIISSLKSKTSNGVLTGIKPDGSAASLSSMPAQTDTLPMRNLENGHLNNKHSHVASVPPVCRRPIRVEDLEEYISSRRLNDCEELRSEYRVSND
jgi:hypothetical protein